VKRLGYDRPGRADKALILRFLERVRGYSRQQIARLVKRGAECHPLLKRYRSSLYTLLQIFSLTFCENTNGSTA
jgi:hypothetical protein